MGTLVTFYSYKGGVGRTMALANIAVLMAAWGKRVLVVDWDLEAPGVEHFLAERAELASIQQGKGLIELLTELSEGTGVSDDVWRPLLQRISVPEVQAPIFLLTAPPIQQV
jgi:Mrp family chromosome partitioning ATPase